MESVFACLTTLPDRTASLKETVDSLLPQVDGIYIFLHGYNPVELPDFLENDKIHIAYDLEWGDKGDLDKFHFVKNLEGYILLCDDDLIYPSDYASWMIKSLNKYDLTKTIMSAHGVIVHNPPIANYYLDRAVLPCLGRVEQEYPVHIGGTGVMVFHSSINFDMDYELKMPNMADIHFGIWAKNKGYDIFTVAHQEGWINHSPYIKDENTIAGKSFNNTFEQCLLINSNASIFRSKTQSSLKKLPKVSIVVVNSRMKSNPLWVKECYDSLRRQNYKDVEIVVIENYDKLITIGKAYNEGAKKAKGKYVLFVADDDFISDDYVSTLVSVIENANIPNTVTVTSYLTMFTNKDGNTKREPRELIPTGMWLRKFLLKNPFREFLVRFVDTELMNRTKDLGFNQLIALHSYGYFYRSHPEQVSGFKAFKGAENQEQHRTEFINQRLKEVCV